MPISWQLREMNPADLKNHLVNIEIYGTQPTDDGMLSSVKELGVLEPLRATQDCVILSGHRRRQHAIAAKLTIVPVFVAEHAIAEAEQVIAIVESNRQREKTMEQKAREYARLAEAKAELARKRQTSTLKKGRESPVGEIVSEREKGRAKEQAAAEVGVSRPTAEKAVEVVEVIDERMAAGDSTGAAELRTMLNEESVAAAHRAAVHDADEDGECVVLDGLDGEVPVNLRSVFAEVKEFKKLRRLCSEIKAGVKNLCNTPAGGWLSYQAIEGHTNEIKRILRFSAPHTECAKCRRKPAMDCKSCKGTGWVTEAMASSSFTESDTKWLESRR